MTSMMDADFVAKKNRLIAPIFFEAGGALLDCQNFEYGLAMLLYALARLGVPGLEVAKIALIIEDKEKRTAGQLVSMLKKATPVPASVERTLTAALRSRNHIVHRAIIENLRQLQKGPLDVAGVVAALREERVRVRGGDAEIRSLVGTLAKQLGFDIGTFEQKIINRLRSQFPNE